MEDTKKPEDRVKNHNLPHTKRNKIKFVLLVLALFITIYILCSLYQSSLKLSAHPKPTYEKVTTVEVWNKPITLK